MKSETRNVLMAEVKKTSSSNNNGNTSLTNSSWETTMIRKPKGNNHLTASSSMKSMTLSTSKSHASYLDQRTTTTTAGVSPLVTPLLSRPATATVDTTTTTTTKIPMQAKEQQRRCLSDTCLLYSRNFSSHQGPMENYRRNATILMTQRSNAPAVMELVQSIRRKCHAARQQQQQQQSEPNDDATTISSSEIPLAECVMIAQLAHDAYYRVIIGSNHGVDLVLSTMQQFPNELHLLEACLQALGNLCDRNGSNQMALQQSNGLSIMLQTMKRFPSSIAIQSAACIALRQLVPLVIHTTTTTVAPRPTNTNSNQELSLLDIEHVLQHALEMYITPRAKEHAAQLLLILRAATRRR